MPIFNEFKLKMHKSSKPVLAMSALVSAGFSQHAHAMPCPNAATLEDNLNQNISVATILSNCPGIAILDCCGKPFAGGVISDLEPQHSGYGIILVDSGVRQQNSSCASRDVIGGHAGSTGLSSDVPPSENGSLHEQGGTNGKGGKSNVSNVSNSSSGSSGSSGLGGTGSSANHGGAGGWSDANASNGGTPGKRGSVMR